MPWAIPLLISIGLARAMIGVGIMDVPAGRKAHARPTPKAGGIAVIGGCMATIGVLSISWHTPWGGWPTPGVAAAVALGLVGLMDDLRDCGPALKLGAQLVAAVLAVGLGSYSSLADAALAVGWLAFITNIFNFMDGLDGLAGGTGLIAAAVLAAAAPSCGAVQMAALGLAVGLAGFLPFNLPPARLFLGDTGSQFCGFLLGVLGLGLARESGSAASFWLLPMLLSGLICDAGLTLGARAWAGASITTAHREHLYQRVRLPAWRVAAVHWGFAALGGMAWQLSVWGYAWRVLPVLVLAHLAWLILAPAVPGRRRSVRIRP